MTPGEGARVLLVDDDAVIAQMYRVKLQRDGHSVRVAGDGEEALEILRGELPDLVFVDVRLPCMGGLSLLAHMREDERTRDLPVVIVSNYGDQELVTSGARLGALAYLVKSQTTPGQLSAGVPDWSRHRPHPGLDAFPTEHFAS